MAEVLNFTKNLRQIIGTELKKYSFKIEGTKFSLKENGNEMYIEFQRSRFNSLGDIYEFYINISIFFQYKRTFSFRLRCPTKLIKPDKYDDFLKMPLEQRDADSFFTEEEKNQLDRYIKLRDWTYKTENELVGKLNIAKDQLVLKIINLFYVKMIYAYENNDDIQAVFVKLLREIDEV
jgi:hypothetical protein